MFCYSSFITLRMPGVTSNCKTSLLQLPSFVLFFSLLTKTLLVIMCSCCKACLLGFLSEVNSLYMKLFIVWHIPPIQKRQMWPGLAFLHKKTDLRCQSCYITEIRGRPHTKRSISDDCNLPFSLS